MAFPTLSYQETMVGTATVTNSEVIDVRRAKTLCIRASLDVDGSIADGTIALQKSMDGVSFTNVATATAVTVDAVVYFDKIDPEYAYARVQTSSSAGIMTTVLDVLVKV